MSVEIKSLRSAELELFKPGILRLMESARGSTEGEERFFNFWKSSLRTDTGRFLLAMDGPNVTGCLCAVFMADDFSEAKRAVESHWFVLPEARKSSAGLRLLSEFEREAKQHGCRSIRTFTTGLSIGLTKIFERRGYKAVSVGFEKVI